MIAAQAVQETRQLLRNGEQLTLTLIIPLLLLIAFSLEPLIDFGGGYTRIDFLTPGVIALAVMSTAFTSQAIATGFERRYGVLKRLGATPLSRQGLIAAKTVTVIAVELLQAAIILLIALAIGWSPNASAAAIVTVPLLVLLGTAAFSGFALLLAGTLRAEATLAAANLIYVVLLGIGGVVFPLTKFPRGARPLLELLPTGALSTGLRDVLANAVAFPVKDVLVLAVWAVLGIGLAARLLPVGVRATGVTGTPAASAQAASARAARAPVALPATLVLVGAVSVQSGAGLAARLFSELPPAAVTTLRLWAAALVMLLIAGRAAARAVAGLAARRAWADGVITLAFGLTLGFMNFAIYQAFARIPLGIAVTIEFLGPLSVTVAGTLADARRASASRPCAAGGSARDAARRPRLRGAGRGRGRAARGRRRHHWPELGGRRLGGRGGRRLGRVHRRQQGRGAATARRVRPGDRDVRGRRRGHRAWPGRRRDGDVPPALPRHRGGDRAAVLGRPLLA